MLQIVSPKEPFDAIVVGSGATGGWAAKELTAAGMRVAALKAGAKIAPRDFTGHQQSWQLLYLGHSQAKPFNWIRIRVLGGRSLSWGRQSYRMSNLGPISHAAMRRYYEKVARDKYKEAVRRGRWDINLGFRAECLARKENYVEIDRDRVDAWGIPILSIHAEYGENEKKLWQDGREQAAAMLEAAGAKDVRLTGQRSVPGFCGHEVGTARMGANPKTSVVNPYCPAHDVRNIFVPAAPTGFRVAARILHSP